MIEELPLYVTLVFAATTLVTVWLLLQSVPYRLRDRFPNRILNFTLAFWMLLQGTLGVGDFYHSAEAFPPRIFLFAVLPALLFIATLFLFFRNGFIDQLSLKTLTILHVSRIFVEIVLLWLARSGQVPFIMTFEGWNFDILSGITAPFIYFLAFRNNSVNRPLLIVWNIICLALLANIVIIAILSLSSPLQKLAFDQPNVAVTYFPFIWLPAVVVPVVLFAHLASLWKLLSRPTNS